MKFERNSIVQHKQSGKYRALNEYAEDRYGNEWTVSGFCLLKDKTLQRWYKPVSFSEYRNAEFLKLVVINRPCDEALDWLMKNQQKSLYELWRTCPSGTWLNFILDALDIYRYGSEPYESSYSPNYEKIYARNIRRAHSWREVEDAYKEKLEWMRLEGRM